MCEMLDETTAGGRPGEAWHNASAPACLVLVRNLKDQSILCQDPFAAGSSGLLVMNQRELPGLRPKGWCATETHVFVLEGCPPEDLLLKKCWFQHVEMLRTAKWMALANPETPGPL